MGLTDRQSAATCPAPPPRGRAQTLLPYEAIEADHRENLSLLRRLAKALRLGKGRDLLVWVANTERKRHAPLQVTYDEIADGEQGIGCSRATAARVVARLRELGLLQVRTLVTPSGQKPNAYRIDWEAVSRAWEAVASGQWTADSEKNDDPCPAAGETPATNASGPTTRRDSDGSKNPESHSDIARVSFCASPSLKLTLPESQIATHIEEIPGLNPPEEIPPNRTVGKASVRSGSVREDVFELDHAEWPEVCEEAKRVIAVLGPHLERENRGQDRELVFKVAWLRHLRQLPEEVTAEALRVVKSGRMQGEPIRNRWGAYRGVIIRRCRAYEIDFHQLLDRVPIPPWAEGIVR